MPNIDRFQVKAKLGAGNQGAVYLCEDPKLKRKVAIKVLNSNLLDRKSGGQVFLQEAQTISQIQHPSIVSIYDMGQFKGRPYLVFEYVEGELLSDRLQRSDVPQQEALDIITGILSGVEHVHQSGIVHRDIKPANIILTEQLVPKIMDFGIARILKSKAGQDAILTGTPRYMAPEYIARGEVSPQVDVFALGAIFYELLTGQRAFNGKDQKELLRNIQNQSVRAPSLINDTIGERLDALILKALEKRPSARYPSAHEMLEALNEYRNSVGESGVDEEHGHSTIDFLLRRMQHTSDFPVLSESIRMLNQLSSSDDKSMDQLAGIIVRDFSLANKILRVVNTAYYGRFSGTIGTVSRAIVVLGIRTIRSIAASLIFFEHLHNKTQATQLKDEIAGAIFSATIARQAADDAELEHVEEGFLCGMLHTLGKILVTYYLHDESEEVQRLVEQEGVSQDTAENRVLGMGFQDLGIAVAEHWKFPKTISSGMVKVDPKQPGDLRDGDVKLRLIANFSNEATHILGEDSEENPARIKKLLQRYRTGLAISGSRFESMVEDARQEFTELSGSLGAQVANDSFIKRLCTPPKSEFDSSVERVNKDDLTQTLILEPSGADQTQSAVMEATPEDPALSAEVVLTEGLQEVTALILDDSASLQQILNVVLETIYRALAIGRIVLALQDANRTNIGAKMGFGNNIDEFIQGFNFPARYSANVFHAALKNGVDLYIANTSDKHIVDDIPDWYKRISKAGSFLVFPLVIKNHPIGLVYADHAKPDGVRLNAKQLNLVKALRNQIIMAMQVRR